MSVECDFSNHDFTQKQFGTRHLQVFLIFLGVSLTLAGRSSISVAVVAMTDANSTNGEYSTFDWDSGERALVLSSFFWGYVLMHMPSGIIADVYSAHKLVSGGVFISSLINAFTPLSVYYFDWTGVIVSRISMGLTQSCLIPCTHTFMSRWIPYEERSRLTSFVLAGPTVGNIITLTISGWLASSTLGWPSIFYVFGAIGMLWALLFYYVAADSPSQHRTISYHERYYIENSLNKSTIDSEIELAKIPWKSILTSLPVWTLIITHCGHAWGFQLFLAKLPAYTKYVLGYDIGQTGVISALPYIAMLLVTFFFGWLCDFALKRNVALFIVRKVSNTIGMWGSSAALIALCLLQTHNTVVPLTMIIVIVALDAANFCGFHVNHIDLAPKFSGVQISIMIAAEIAFAQTAPIFCGYIVTDESNIDQWHIVFYIASGLSFMSNLCFITFGKVEIQSWN